MAEAEGGEVYVFGGEEGGEDGGGVGALEGDEAVAGSWDWMVWREPWVGSSFHLVSSAER